MRTFSAQFLLKMLKISVFTVRNVQYLQSVTLVSNSKKRGCKEICTPWGKRDTGAITAHPSCDTLAFSSVNFINLLKMSIDFLNVLGIGYW